MLRKTQLLLSWLRPWQGRGNKIKRCQGTYILNQPSSCPPFTCFLRGRWGKLFLKCRSACQKNAQTFGDEGGNTAVPAFSVRRVLPLYAKFEVIPEQGSGLVCSVLDRNRGYIDILCSDILKFPICPGLSASALTLQALACLFFLSNLIHHGNCQLGAFESWGLLKIF